MNESDVRVINSGLDRGHVAYYEQGDIVNSRNINSPFYPVDAPVGNETFRPVNPETSYPENNVTSFADLQAYNAGTVVKFPDFAEGQPFVARVRRPSLLALAKQGRIPNSLLASASDLFSNGGAAVASSDGMLSDMYDICHIICEAALISPTLSEIESAGLVLSDDQLMAIFSYAQTGVDALKPFRTE